jgi:lipoprotein-releasing system permease protein
VNLFGFNIWRSGVYFFSEIPNTVDKNWAVIIVMSGIVMAILGALVPALRAARIQPVEALRYE